MSRDSHQNLLDLLDLARVQRGAFARLLTEIECLGVQALTYKELLEPPRLAFRVGITGCMGVGKSVFINTLLRILADHHSSLKVGVLAIDPTSPFSGGGFLGDRVRLSSISSQVFFRSMGSRGSLGGIAAQAYLMLRAFDWAGFDLVFLETVGVGQTDCEVMHATDVVALLLSPENGDDVQIIKSGLMEIADIFIVNKSDRPGASFLKSQLLKGILTERDVVAPSLFSTAASTEQGVDVVLDHFLELQNQGLFQQKRWSIEKLQAEARALIRLKYEGDFLPSILKIKTCKDLQKLLCD